MSGEDQVPNFDDTAWNPDKLYLGKINEKAQPLVSFWYLQIP